MTPPIQIFTKLMFNIKLKPLPKLQHKDNLAHFLPTVSFKSAPILLPTWSRWHNNYLSLVVLSQCLFWVLNRHSCYLDYITKTFEREEWRKTKHKLLSMLRLYIMVGRGYDWRSRNREYWGVKQGWELVWKMSWCQEAGVQIHITQVSV